MAGGTLPLLTLRPVDAHHRLDASITVKYVIHQDLPFDRVRRSASAAFLKRVQCFSHHGVDKIFQTRIWSSGGHRDLVLRCELHGRFSNLPQAIFMAMDRYSSSDHRVSLFISPKWQVQSTGIRESEGLCGLKKSVSLMI